jgi:ABC-2 type transport system permease protein
MSTVATPEVIAELGDPIKGPSALGSDYRRLGRLTWTLAVTDFKLKFFDSALGYLWQIMQPLMLFGVLYTVFSVVLNFKGTEAYYPVALLMGLVLFSFLSETTIGAIRSVSARESLVRKIEFPRLAIPGAQVTMAMFNLCLNMIPVFVFLIFAGGRPRWTWLEVPFLLILLAMFCLGFAMLLSALWVRYRDVDPIWTVVLQGLFYASPIIYTISIVQKKAGDNIAGWLMINPFTAVLQQCRYAILGPTSPSVAAVMGSTWLVLVPILLIGVSLAIGGWVFNRMAPIIAEEL